MTESDRNIVLTGFMGTGKTVVARAVAKALGRPLVDMDAEIVSRAGKDIPAIFREEGEEAFREHERVLCRELATRRGLVIATGGGALVDDANRNALGQSGMLVCLDCRPAELVHRLRGDAGRPMLWAEDPEARLRELLAERRPAYARIPYHIDTTHRSPEQTADDVLALYRAEPVTWEVGTPGGSYFVHLIPGGLAMVGALLQAHGVGPNVAVVSDEHVWPLHGERLWRGLGDPHRAMQPVVLPAGEQHKALDTLGLLYDRFAEGGLDRSGVVVAVGGGVVTDMAGLAAATYMRGVHLVQVPTTLLGMVDASIGGKVAVDHPRGKNLIGAFVEPLFVMLDPEVLATLPDAERRAGLAEVIKAGIIGDVELFEALERDGEPPLRWLVGRAIQVKKDVVEEDPYERGRRAVLNLGHTFAHAFESLSGYRLRHGLAVAAGMAAAAHLAEIRGLCTEDTRTRIVSALARRGLPTSYDAHPAADVYEAMRADKKRRGSRLRFVLPRAIGDVIVDEEVPKEDVLEALERIRP